MNREFRCALWGFLLSGVLRLPQPGDLCCVQFSSVQFTNNVISKHFTRSKRKAGPRAKLHAVEGGQHRLLSVLPVKRVVSIKCIHLYGMNHFHHCLQNISHRWLIKYLLLFYVCFTQADWSKLNKYVRTTCPKFARKKSRLVGIHIKCLKVHDNIFNLGLMTLLHMEMCWKLRPLVFSCIRIRTQKQQHFLTKKNDRRLIESHFAVCSFFRGRFPAKTSPLLLMLGPFSVNEPAQPPLIYWPAGGFLKRLSSAVTGGTISQQLKTHTLTSDLRPQDVIQHCGHDVASTVVIWLG